MLKLNQSYSDITNDLIKIGENASISLQSLIDQAKGKRAKPDMKAANKVYNLTNMFIDKYFKTSKSKKNKTNNFKKIINQTLIYQVMRVQVTKKTKRLIYNLDKQSI